MHAATLEGFVFGIDGTLCASTTLHKLACQLAAHELKHFTQARMSSCDLCQCGHWVSSQGTSMGTGRGRGTGRGMGLGISLGMGMGMGMGTGTGRVQVGYG